MSRSTLHIVNNHEEMVLWVIYTDADMKENHNYLHVLKYKNHCCIRLLINNWVVSTVSTVLMYALF